MKKRFFSLLLCTALLLSVVFSAHTAWADTASGDGTIYTDPETGVAFVVPGNWEERELDSDSSKSFHARFHSLEDSRDLFLFGYLDVWNEMPALERSGHTRSDVDTSYFYAKETLRELFVTLFAQSDFAVAADDVQFVRCGKNEYVEIAFVREVGSRTVTFISSMYIENGYGYFFTFGAASDAAIEDYRSVLSSMQVPLPDQSSPGDRESNQNSDNIYVEPETEISFAVPERWVQQDLDEGTSNNLVTFISLDDPGSYFDYDCHDLWSEMTESERSGRTRSEIGNDYIYTYDLAKRMLIRHYAQINPDITIQDVQLITHGNTEYIEISTPYESDGTSLTLITAVHIENGYAHQFIFAGVHDQAIEDFRFVLDSFREPPTPGVDPAANESDLNSGGIYVDADMEMHFELPVGWVEKEPDAETAYPSVTFVFLKDPRNTFQYSSYDLWGQMPFWGRFFLPRSEVNSASVYEQESMMEAIVNRFSQGGLNVDLDDIQLVTYGENEFIEVPITMQADGILLSTTQFIHIKNGRVYLFAFGRQNDEAAADFESVLASLQVSPAGGSVFSSSALSTLNIVMVALEFFLTFFIYALPPLIYRHFIRKSPMSRKKALIVLTVYEAAAYVLTRIVWLLLTQYTASCLILIFWSLLTYLNIIPRRNSRSTSKKAGHGAASPQAAGTAVPQISSAVFPSSAQAAPPAPASVMPASPTPAAPAVLQTPPAASSISAAPSPAIPAPQTPPSPAAYAPASAALSAFPAYSPTTATPSKPGVASPQTPPAPRIQFCKNCGFRLLDDSKFCSVCGALAVPAAKE